MECDNLLISHLVERVLCVLQVSVYGHRAIPSSPLRFLVLLPFLPCSALQSCSACFQVFDKSLVAGVRASEDVSVGGIGLVSK